MRICLPTEGMSVKLLKIIWYTTIFVLMSLLFSLLILEYLAGCGAMYTDSEGVRHTRECLFINAGGK